MSRQHTRKRSSEHEKQDVGRPSLYPNKERGRHSSYAFTHETHDKIDDVAARLAALHKRPVSRTDAVEHMIVEFPIGSLRKAAS